MSCRMWFLLEQQFASGQSAAAELPEVKTGDTITATLSLSQSASARKDSECFMFSNCSF